ncbi:MAG: ABC transporter substrate-binding protein [Chloroflexi bacterium]|nr:ABC transporter substrate-binding protein [Chloroflexota bacterium]
MNRLVTTTLALVLFLALLPNLPTQAQGFYNEAPMLTTLVNNGELPPVDERLPIAPMVVQPNEEVGQYGGTWEMALLGTRDRSMLRRTMWYEGLVRWDTQWLRVVPNIAQSVDVSDDSTTYTFALRQGMRWSDGAPFTTDDILFWYEDLMLNPDVPVDTPAWMLNGDGTIANVEKVDETTVVFRFNRPNGLFLQNLAHPEAIEPIAYPKHYLSQFHATYNTDTLDAILAEEGIEPDPESDLTLWARLLIRKGVGSGRWRNPELPTLNAWILQNPYDDETTELTAARNPYYWKVDTDFNQLPYIDYLHYSVHEEADTIVEAVLNGEIDMQDRHIGSFDNRALFEEGATAAGYNLYTTIPQSSNTVVFMLNLTHHDPVLRDIFNNKDFRVALSTAINRQEIIDTVYSGIGQPHQVAPAPQSPFYDETMATQYLDYNVDEANALLDGMGLAERDGDGFRLRPDGEQLAFTVTVSSNDPSNSNWPGVMELVAGYWEAIGVAVMVDVVEREVAGDRVIVNEHDAYIWEGLGGLEVILEPTYYLPFDGTSAFGIPWAEWFVNANGDLAEAPPEAVQQQMNLYRQLRSTADSAQQSVLMSDILSISAEQFFTIGISLPGNSFGIVKTNFHNVPEVMPLAWAYPTPAPANPEQFFITQD